MNKLVDHTVSAIPFHFFFRREHNAMPEYGRSNIDNIIRIDKIPASHSCKSLGPVKDTDGGTGRGSEINILIVTGAAHNSSDECQEFFFYMNFMNLVTE